MRGRRVGLNGCLATLAACDAQSEQLRPLSRQAAADPAKLDQVTQQNAALVEESAAAAESLKNQAAGLADAVRVFGLAGGRPRARPRAGQSLTLTQS